MHVAILILSTLFAPTRPAPSAPTLWTHIGGSSTHTSRAEPFAKTPWNDAAHLWTQDSDSIGPLEFLAHSSVVADQRRVYAGTFGVLAAFDLATGDADWSVDVAFPILDSWSSPTIDVPNFSVIYASGFRIESFDRATGSPLWSTDLGRPIVNASPCVTSDLGAANRVFITDHSFGSTANGTLTCINTSEFHAAHNPYHPGDVVWETPLPGNTSGNTPAYKDGVVYVATSDDGSGGPGSVLAFDASATSAPVPIWTCVNPVPIGFFSAVTIHNTHVYASSYNFSAGQRNANTLKINAQSGSLVWSTSSVRTNISPVIVDHDTILVSGGVPFAPSSPFSGSVPSIELIHDLGSSASLVWDSFGATHQDLNNDGDWDLGEPFLSLGGWGHTPVVLATTPPTLLVATMNEPSFFQPLTHASALHIVDLSASPNDPGFIRQTIVGTGTTPAVVGSRVLSTSELGLSAHKLRRVTSPLNRSARP